MSITIHDNTGSTFTIPLQAGVTLAQLIWTSGHVDPPALCSALGRCKRCIVRLSAHVPEPTEADLRLLSAQELADGMRLACRHVAKAGMVVHIPVSSTGHNATTLQPGSTLSPSTPAPAAADSAAPPCGTLHLAIDLGTTSLQWVALDSDGHTFSAGTRLNPQMGAGSEVMSRLAAASTAEGRATLQRLTVTALQRIIAALEDASGSTVGDLCVAANPAMTLILLNRDVAGIATAPYHLDLIGGTQEHIPGLPPVWIPPQPSPFVGGDLSAGMCALLHEHAPTYPFLLADLGTNGECILALGPDDALVASVALGPALEGIGLTHGCVAQPGAITSFSLTPAGLVAHVLNADATSLRPLHPGEAATGISGTGYLSLVHALLRAGLLDNEGRFVTSPLSPLAQKLAASHFLQKDDGEMRLSLSGGLALYASDVEELLKVKAAFSLAVERLLHAANLPRTALTALYLAGALGMHATPSDLEGIGFLPPGMAARAVAVGNTSLRGAALLLTDPELRAPLSRWRDGCRALDLTADPGFSAAFLRHMRFGL